MPDTQENKSGDIRTINRKAVRDLVIIFAFSIFIFILSYFFDMFVFIIRFLEGHPAKIIYLDEVITALLTLSIGFAIFSWRRWSELKKETTDRIAAQEALVRLAETKAEVARIINKQLQQEIEARANIEKELLLITIKSNLLCC